MKNLIPKSLAKQKGIFYRNILWADIGVYSIVLAISCGITFGMIFIGWIARVISAFVLSGFISLFLLPSSRNNDCKLYKLIYYKIKYISSPKVYAGIMTSELCPYHKVEQGEILCKTPKDGPACYLKMIKIRGLDISSMDNKEASLKLESFHNILMNQKKKCSIAKINTKYSASIQLKYWEKQKILNKELYDFCKISEATYKQKQKQIVNQIEILNHVEKELKADPYQSNYYFIIYEDKIDELKKRSHEIRNDFEQLGLEAEILNYYDTINALKNIYNPLNPDIYESTIDSNKDKLDEIFQFEKVEFKKDYIEINDSLLLSFQAVSDYPFEIDNYWLAFIFLSSNANMMFNMKQIEQVTALSLINKAIVNSASNEFNEKKQVQKYQLSQVNEGFKRMAQEISRNNQVVFNTNLLILNYDVETKSLEKSNKEIQKILKSRLINVNRLKYRQFEALDSFLPKLHDDLIKTTGREIPSKTLAGAYPFISSTLSDPNGMTLGLDWLRKPIMFDPFLLDGNRKNHNIMVLGSSGSGKSFFTKKIINWCANTNKRIFILDVEREYKNITKAYDGDWIDIGTGTEGYSINPLEIIVSDKLSSAKLISNHLLFLETFFQILLSDIDNMKIRYLIALIKNLYYYMQLDKKEIELLSASSFPTFSDLYNYAVSKNNTIKDAYAIEDVNVIHEILKSDFVGESKLGWLYDKHSTINISKKIVCFDINSLFDKNNHKLTQAQLFLALSYMQKEIKDNDITKDPIMIVIDEAHLLIDENNPIGLDFVYQMVKRIRKRNGSIMIISQNPDDFVSNPAVAKKTKAIVNNTQYSFFFNLSPNNVKDVADMYSNYGSGLSEDEKLFIAKAKRGQALFFASGFDRHKVDIFVSDEEKKTF